MCVVPGVVILSEAMLAHPVFVKVVEQKPTPLQSQEVQTLLPVGPAYVLEFLTPTVENGPVYVGVCDTCLATIAQPKHRKYAGECTAACDRLSKQSRTCFLRTPSTKSPTSAIAWTPVCQH